MKNFILVYSFISFFFLAGANMLLAQGHPVRGLYSAAKVSAEKAAQTTLQSTTALGVKGAVSSSTFLSERIASSLQDASRKALISHQTKRNLYTLGTKVGFSKRSTLQALYKLGAQSGKKIPGYTTSISTFIEDAKKRFGVNTDNELFNKLTSSIEHKYPSASGQYAYRGLLIKEAQALMALGTNGMPLSLVADKNLMFLPPGETMINAPQYSDICFANHPQTAAFYALGQGVGSRFQNGGFITLVIAKKPADLNHGPVWTLGRDMKASEIEAILVLDPHRLQWFSVFTKDNLR